MPNEKNYDKAVAQFVVVLFHAGTNTHLMHLQTKSYSQHKALGHFYEAIVDLADKYAEAYQGCYGIIETYPQSYHGAVNPLTYLEKIKDYVVAAEKTLPEEPNLQNSYADILDLLDTTIYKLKNLK